MENDIEEKSGKKKMIISLIILILVVFTVVVMVLNSRKPKDLVLGDINKEIKGTAFTKTNLLMLENLYKNWLPNDLYWPTVFLDNMPNYQLGMLEVVRYNVRVMRDNLTRVRTTDKLDSSIEGAFTSISNDPFKWWFPSSEDRWELAHKNMDTFYQGLSKGESSFYARADNLVELLSQYISLMGGVNTRLIHAPRDMKTVLPIDEEPQKESEIPKMVDVQVPWFKIDDNFYYAQGVAYAILQSFMAIRTDFNNVLVDKNSLQLFDKIIEDLGRCDFEPLFIFNGDLDSIFANHSLNLSGVFNDARQKMNSLIISLQQG